MTIINKSNLHQLSTKAQNSLLKNMLRLPTAAKQQIAGEPIIIDGQTFDLSLQVMLQLFGPPPNHLPSVAEARATIEAQSPVLSQTPLDDIIKDEFPLTMPDGETIRLRRYRHRNAPRDNQPALVFYHGGGYVGGSLNSHDLVCQHLANGGECTVIAVDYRLAPEYPYPTPVNDGLTAYRYIASHADKFGIDANRLAVGGDSAGGNLAAVVAQQTKNDTHPPKLQLLWVPWVDMSGEHESYELFATGFLLEQAQMRWYTHHYLGDTDDIDTTDPMISPIYGDLQGVAPAVVMVAGFDPLRDEGIEYADKLTAAGVDTELQVYDSLTHLFMLYAGEIDAAKAAFEDAVQALKRL